jgi:methanogenic corrinoid protein MtbC1
LYDVELIAHLQLVKQALDSGHRARQVVGLSLSDLKGLLGIVEFENTDVVDCGEQPEVEVLDPIFHQWMLDVRELNTKELLSHFRLALSQLGLRAFVIERIVPFLELLGCAWLEGDIQVFQEHFVTRLITQFLEEHWQMINTSNIGATIVLTSHPLERHTLGLHLVACMLVMSGYSVIMLGNNTPVEEIGACAVQTQALAIAITFSVTMDPEDSRLFLQSLQSHLDNDVSKIPTFLVFGGAGAPHPLPEDPQSWLLHTSLSTLSQAIQNHPVS